MKEKHKHRRPAGFIPNNPAGRHLYAVHPPISGAARPNTETPAHSFVSLPAA